MNSLSSGRASERHSRKIVPGHNKNAPRRHVLVPRASRYLQMTQFAIVAVTCIIVVSPLVMFGVRGFGAADVHTAVIAPRMTPVEFAPPVMSQMAQSTQSQPRPMIVRKVRVFTVNADGSIRR